MEQRKSIRLSAVLFIFGVRLLLGMALCGLLWLALLSYLQIKGIVYPGHIANLQVSQVMQNGDDSFKADDHFLADYVYLNHDNEIIDTNVSNTKCNAMIDAYLNDKLNNQSEVKTYTDGNYVIMQWEFKKEFAHPLLRKYFSFELLWWISLITAWVISCVVNVLSLKNKLSKNLEKFSTIADNISNQQLDFTILPSGIDEFDVALNAMETMKETLKETLETNWKDQQQRTQEINALAHDLKTPLTVIGGYAQLLAEEPLTNEQLVMIEAINTSNEQAKDYVQHVMDVTNGLKEAKVNVTIDDFMHHLYRSVIDYASSNTITLQFNINANGRVSVQLNLLMRALSNIIGNAIEHSPAYTYVVVTSMVNENTWIIVIKDSGSGFSQQALINAKKRFWQDDCSRMIKTHHGIGLYFANQVIENHNGQMELRNDHGGVVTLTLPLI